MSVYKKLGQARIDLQNTKLEKSGHNKFAGYKYFELGDFMPAINNIFNSVGLCGVVSFTADLATLTLTDVEDATSIVITSPMGSAALKGCHEVQNIGAVETYQRRYLWVAAMEMVEHDALDATTGNDDGNAASRLKPAIKQSPAPNLLPPQLSQDEVALCITAMNGCTEYEALKGIGEGVYARADELQKKTLFDVYNAKKLLLEKEVK